MNAAPRERAELSLRIVIGLSVVGGLALLLGIVWAASDSNVFMGLRYLADNRWGLVTLIDVYAGALVVAVWMWCCRRSVVTWLAWVLALVCLGHLASLLYLLVRASRSRTLVEVFAPAELSGRGVAPASPRTFPGTEPERSGRATDSRK